MKIDLSGKVEINWKMINAFIVENKFPK